MRALEKANPIQGGLPFLHEIQRNNVRIVVEPIADYIDPPRVYPLVGPAQLHHCPLQVHRVLHRGHAGWLADPVHQHRRGRPRGPLHRPRPSPHGRERGSRPGQQLLRLAECSRRRPIDKERLPQTPVVSAAGVCCIDVLRLATSAYPWLPNGGLRIRFYEAMLTPFRRILVLVLVAGQSFVPQQGCGPTRPTISSPWRPATTTTGGGNWPSRSFGLSEISHDRRAARAFFLGEACCSRANSTSPRSSRLRRAPRQVRRAASFRSGEAAYLAGDFDGQARLRFLQVSGDRLNAFVALLGRHCCRRRRRGGAGYFRDG